MLRRWVTSHTLQLANQQTLENLSRLVAVSDIFESFGRILSADIEKDFLATAVKRLLVGLWVV